MFEFDADLAVQEDLFVEETGQSYPAIVWHGRYEGDASSGGFFTLDVDAVEGTPDGWEKTEIQFGNNDPTAPFVPVYKTTALRMVPIGVRKRIIVTDELRNDHVYPWRTPKRARVEGRFTSHYQIMVMVPGLSELCVLGLRGQTKTTSWDNDADGRYRNESFPTGVEQLLSDFADAVSKKNGRKLPGLCLWEIMLTPWMKEDKPVYLSVGRAPDIAHMNPFTAVMSAENSSYIDARFVGNAGFETFQEMRQTVAVEWEKQWSNAQAMQEAASLNALFVPAVAETVEDEIPF